MENPGIEEAEKSVGFLCHKFTALFSKIKVVEAERDELLHSSRVAEAEVERLVDRLSKYEAHVEAEKLKLDNELRAWRTKTEASDHFMTSIKADRDDLEYELKMMRDKLKQMTEKEAINEQLLSEAREQCESLETERSKLDVNSQSQQARMTQLNDQLVSAETETMNLRRQNSSYKQILEAREDEMRQHERRYNEELIAFRSQKEELARTSRLLSVESTKVADATNLSASMDAHIADLKERLDALRNRNKVLEQEKVTTAQRLEATEAKERDLQGVIAKECHQNEDIRKAMNELEMERVRAVEETASIRADFNAEKAQCELLKTQSQHWEDKVSTQTRQLEGYKEEAKSTQEHVALLQQQKEGMESVNASLRNELKDFWLEKERLLNSNKREQAQVDQWKKKAQNIMPQLEEAKTRQVELERRLRKDDALLAEEQETKMKLQREARISAERIKALNRKCDMLMNQGIRGGTRQHFEKMLSRENPRADLGQHQSPYISPSEGAAMDCDDSTYHIGEPLHVGEPFRSIGQTHTLDSSYGKRKTLDSGYLPGADSPSSNPVEFLCNFIEKQEQELGFTAAKRKPEVV